MCKVLYNNVYFSSLGGIMLMVIEMKDEKRDYIAFDSKKQKEIDLLVRELKIMGHSDESIELIGEHSHLFTKKSNEEKKSKSK